MYVTTQLLSFLNTAHITREDASMKLPGLPGLDASRRMDERRRVQEVLKGLQPSVTIEGTLLKLIQNECELTRHLQQVDEFARNHPNLLTTRAHFAEVERYIDANNMDQVVLNDLLLEAKQSHSELLVLNRLTDSHRFGVPAGTGAGKFHAFPTPAFSPDGTRIAVARSQSVGDNTTSQIYSFGTKSGEEAHVHLTDGFVGEVTALTYLRDGRILAAVSNSNASFFGAASLVFINDSIGERQEVFLRGPTSPITHLTLTYGSELLLTESNGTVFPLELDHVDMSCGRFPLAGRIKPDFSPLVSATKVTSMAWDADSDSFARGTSMGDIQLVNWNGIAQKTIHVGPLQAVDSLHVMGKNLLAILGNHLAVINLVSHDILLRTQVRNTPISAIALGPEQSFENAQLAYQDTHNGDLHLSTLERNIA